MVTVIAAYYDGELPLRFEEISLNRWRQSVEDRIAWVTIEVQGQRPWGNPDITYRMRLLGSDAYYYERSGQSHNFGVMDDDGHARHYVWTDDGPVAIRTYSPDSRNLKRGVLLPDDDAREVGLIK